MLTISSACSPFRFKINILAQIIAVGSVNPDNLKTEIYDDETGTWTSFADYPYAGFPYNSFYLYSSVYNSGAFYFFGGAADFATKKIARFDEVSHLWSLAGSLKGVRDGHAVIFNGSAFIVIGGSRNHTTENCYLEGTVMTCTEHQSPALYSYYTYPALFLTDDNYGDNC